MPPCTPQSRLRRAVADTCAYHTPQTDSRNEIRAAQLQLRVSFEFLTDVLFAASDSKLRSAHPSGASTAATTLAGRRGRHNLWITYQRIGFTACPLRRSHAHCAPGTPERSTERIFEAAGQRATTLKMVVRQRAIYTIWTLCGWHKSSDSRTAVKPETYAYNCIRTLTATPIYLRNDI